MLHLNIFIQNSETPSHDADMKPSWFQLRWVFLLTIGFARMWKWMAENPTLHDSVRCIIHFTYTMYVYFRIWRQYLTYSHTRPVKPPTVTEWTWERFKSYISKRENRKTVQEYVFERTVRSFLISHHIRCVYSQL